MTDATSLLGATNLEQMAAAVRVVAAASLDVQARAGAQDAANYLAAVARRAAAPASWTDPVKTLPPGASERELRQVRLRQAAQRAEDIYLPLGRPGSVALPNALLRSALFSSANHQGDAVKEEVIAAQGDVSITLTGLRLGGYDRRVFAVCLQAYQQDCPLPGSADPESAWILSSFYQLSQLLGVSYGEQVRAAIRASLIRLNAALLRVRYKRRDVPLPRLVEVVFDESAYGERGAGTIQFRVHKCIAQLFGVYAWTHVSEAALHQFSGLAAWLAAFYQTHAGPYPLLLADLKQYSGQDCEPREFKRRLLRALEQLQDEDVPEQVRVAGFELEGHSITVHLLRWRK